VLGGTIVQQLSLNTRRTSGCYRFCTMSISPRPLDDVDRRMLSILVDDGRMSVNEVANRAGVSRATAYSRYDRLVTDGVIRGFRADVDPRAIGLDVAAMILVNVEQGSWPTTRDKVSRLPGVEYVAMTSGEFDFVLLVRMPDIAALRDVILHRLQGMPEVRSTHTIFVLDEQRHPIGSAHHLEPVIPQRPVPRVPGDQH
jgi:DNA-binding Lrp family transcriptional regulator